MRTSALKTCRLNADQLIQNSKLKTQNFPCPLSIAVAFRRSNSTTAANVATSNNHWLGYAGFYGNSGSGFTNGALIAAVQTGNASTYTPTDLTFWTSSGGSNWAEAMRIDSSGRVGIGTTSPNASVKLHVETATGHAGYFVQSGVSQTGAPAVVVQKQDNNNTTSQLYVAFNFNAGFSGGGGIQGNGATGVQFYSSSDIRLKENISGLESQLEKIALLKPSRFDLKNGPKDCVGLIAQEVEEIYPDAVGEDANGYKTIGGISIMETRLIKAIQELKAENDSLKARIAALEAA